MKAKIDHYMRYRFLLMELVKKGIRLKYRRSYLGIVWSLVEPLLTMIVLTIVFGTLLGEHTRDFPVYILSGRLLYDVFSKGTKGALKSIRQNASMIKKVYVPKYLYPISSVLFNFVIFLISLVVLAAVALFLGVYPTIYLVQAIVPLAILLILTLGVGLILSSVAVFFRDIEYLWTVALMLIMYTCAIFYKAKVIIEAGVGWILEINPLYCIISCFRNAMFGEVMNMQYLAYSAVFSLVSLLVGLFVFYKKQDEFILHL